MSSLKGIERSALRKQAEVNWNQHIPKVVGPGVGANTVKAACPACDWTDEGYAAGPGNLQDKMDAHMRENSMAKGSKTANDYGGLVQCKYPGCTHTGYYNNPAIQHEERKGYCSEHADEMHGRLDARGSKTADYDDDETRRNDPNRDRATDPMEGDQTSCRNCQSDIEYHGPIDAHGVLPGEGPGWHDRGGNSYCDTSGAARWDENGVLVPYPHVKHEPYSDHFASKKTHTFESLMHYSDDEAEHMPSLVSRQAATYLANHPDLSGASTPLPTSMYDDCEGCGARIASFDGTHYVHADTQSPYCVFTPSGIYDSADKARPKTAIGNQWQGKEEDFPGWSEHGDQGYADARDEVPKRKPTGDAKADAEYEREYDKQKAYGDEYWKSKGASKTAINVDEAKAKGLYGEIGQRGGGLKGCTECGALEDEPHRPYCSLAKHESKTAVTFSPMVAGEGASLRDPTDSGSKKPVPAGTVATPGQKYQTFMGTMMCDYKVEGVDGEWQLSGDWTPQGAS